MQDLCWLVQLAALSARLSVAAGSLLCQATHMSSVDYVALDGDGVSPPSWRTPLRLLSGLAGMLGAAWSAAHMRSHMSTARSKTPETWGPQFVHHPNDGVENVLLKFRPYGPGGLTVIPPKSLIEQPCCIFGTDAMFDDFSLAITIGSNTRKAWLYGAKPTENDFIFPTSQPDNIVKGKLLCFSARNMQHRLRLIDKFVGYYPDFPDQVRRR
eukprot:g2902.t1